MNILDHAIKEIAKTIDKLQLWSEKDECNVMCAARITFFLGNISNKEVLSLNSQVGKDIHANFLLICNDLVNEQLLLEERVSQEKSDKDKYTLLYMMGRVEHLLMLAKVCFKNIFLDKINDENIIKSLLKIYDQCIVINYQFSNIQIPESLRICPSPDMKLEESIKINSQLLQELLDIKNKDSRKEEYRQQFVMFLDNILPIIHADHDVTLILDARLVTSNLLLFYQEIIKTNLLFCEKHIEDDQLYKLFSESAIHNLQTISKYCSNIFTYKIKDLKQIKYLQNCTCIK
ncbi:hypothetical protein AB837_00510 [bacterium AB1]|nr:hypothetical protein AB837_00510 [bacterium AB1]